MVESRRLIAGMRAGAIESSRTPSPTRSGTASESPASCPHTATGIPARHTWATRRSVAVPNGFARPRTRAFIRSTAYVYWMRSLVPIEAKSISSRNCRNRFIAPNIKGSYDQRPLERGVRLYVLVSVACCWAAKSTFGPKPPEGVIMPSDNKRHSSYNKHHNQR